MIARTQHGCKRPHDRRHAAGRGKGVFGAFQRRDALFKHPGCRVAIAGIDKFIVASLQKPGLGGLGGGIDKALGQENRLGHLAVLTAAAAFMHQFGAGFPSVAHALPRLARCQRKTPDTKKARG